MASFWEKPGTKKLMKNYKFVVIAAGVLAVLNTISDDETTKRIKFYTSFGYVVLTVIAAFGPSVLKGVVGGKRSCKETPFVPYMEYMDRLYHNEDDTRTYNKYKDKTDESPFHERLERSVGGGGQGRALLDASGVHAMFDRLSLAAPEFVSMTPALLAGALVFVFITYEGYDFSIKEKARIDAEISLRAPITTSNLVQEVVDAVTPVEAQMATRLSKDAMALAQQCMDNRWMAFMGLALGIAGVAAKFVVDGVYLALILRVCKNRKHWAAVKFTSYYAKALGIKCKQF